MSASDAESLKNKGNELFKQGLFGAAADMYGRAIEIAPSAMLYSNRAFAYIKSEGSWTNRKCTRIIAMRVLH